MAAQQRTSAPAVRCSVPGVRCCAQGNGYKAPRIEVTPAGRCAVVVLISTKASLKFTEKVPRKAAASG